MVGNFRKGNRCFLGNVAVAISTVRSYSKQPTFDLITVNGPPGSWLLFTSVKFEIGAWANTLDKLADGEWLFAVA